MKAGLDRLFRFAPDRLFFDWSGQKLPSRSHCTSIPGGASASGWSPIDSLTDPIGSAAESRLIASLHRGVRSSLLSEGEGSALGRSGFLFKHHKSTDPVSTQAPHHLLPSRRRQLSPIKFDRNPSIRISAAAPIATSAALECNRPSPAVAHPIEFGGCRFSIRCLPSNEPRKNLHIASHCSRLKSHDQLEAAHRLLPFTLLLQQTSPFSPLFTSGEGGPPAAPGPLVSCWQKRGTWVSSDAPARGRWPFPRYLTPTGRCFWCTCRLAARPALNPNRRSEMSECHGGPAVWRTSLHGLRHGRGLSVHPCAHTYRLPICCRGLR